MKRLVICILLITGCNLVYSQRFKDSIYLDKNFDRVKESRASYLRVTTSDSATNLFFIMDYYISGGLYKTGMYKDSKGRIPEGTVYKYYPGGKVKHEAVYKNGTLTGEVRSYYENGNILRVEKYENDKLIASKYYTQGGKDTTMMPFFRMPFYKGGANKLDSVIASSIIYPPDARHMGLEGVVTVAFVVKKAGYVADITALKSPNYIFNKEAIRVVYLTRRDWEPGIEDGELADVAISYPVVFKWSER